MQVLSIDVLPDDVLLAIFEFCAPKERFDYYLSKKDIECWWQRLVHVCRRWRTLVFESPRHFNLRLACAPGTPARDALDVWPTLPLVISTYDSATKGRMDDMLAVLEYSHRVCEIRLLDLTRSDLNKVYAAMQVPFPELTDLVLSPGSNEDSAVVPDSFLGGSAPLLRVFVSFRIPFPSLPKLLLSAPHLATLDLSGIPHSGYFSPDTLLAALFVCTGLRYLSLTFKSPKSCPDKARRPSPPPERIVLPVLTNVFFVGASEYFEDLVARIDAPLDSLGICFFNDIVLEAPQLIQFISRTPTLKSLEEAEVDFMKDFARVVFLSNRRGIRVDILCRGLEWQVSFLEQICNSFLPFQSKLEHLSITSSFFDSDRIDNIETTLWLEALRPFAAVKKLELIGNVLRRYIVPTLQELVGDRTTEVLPALESITLMGLELEPQAVQEGIRQFVAARQVAGHPITVN